MVRVIGVRFKRAGKVYYFDPGEFELTRGANVIVETARGIEFGEAVGAPKDVPEEEITAPLKKVLRPATAVDEAQLKENTAREKEAFAVAEKKIGERGLEMDLVDVEFTFDGNKIIFYFTAEGRVDFRELVRDLAAVFRTRIELRQIGVRDEAKMLGGIGPCGRCLCCCTFLGDFAPVSIKMAKEQNLSLNPTKISGLCGRLLCCLRYESEHYECAKSSFPSVGTPVATSDGDGKVASVNVIKGTVSVEFPTGATHDYPSASVRSLRQQRPTAPPEPAAEAGPEDICAQGCACQAAAQAAADASAEAAQSTPGESIAPSGDEPQKPAQEQQPQPSHQPLPPPQPRAPGAGEQGRRDGGQGGGRRRHPRQGPGDERPHTNVGPVGQPKAKGADGDQHQGGQHQGGQRQGEPRQGQPRQGSQRSGGRRRGGRGQSGNRPSGGQPTEGSSQ